MAANVWGARAHQERVGGGGMLMRSLFSREEWTGRDCEKMPHGNLLKEDEVTTTLLAAARRRMVPTNRDYY